MNQSKQRYLIIVLALCFALGLNPDSGFAAGQEEVEPEGQTRMRMILEELRKPSDRFFYHKDDRPDPFRPFISDKPKEPLPTDEPELLTGLRRFEPNQLRLSAVLLGGGPSLAMLVDSSGFGHIVRIGSAVGRSGIVERIASDRIIIRQQLTSLSGERDFRSVEMLLKREGED